MSLSHSQSEKIERIRRLAREGATEGERQAAREALRRMGADNGKEAPYEINIPEHLEMLDSLMFREQMQKIAEAIENMEYSFEELERHTLKPRK